MGPRPEVFAKKGPEAGKYSQKKIRSQLGILHSTGIKSIYKLCDHSKETKRVDDNYDPTQKYRLVWDVTAHNVNQCVEKADIDRTIDETTHSNESPSDMHDNVKGKPGISKGGEFCTDYYRDQLILSFLSLSSLVQANILFVLVPEVV